MKKKLMFFIMATVLFCMLLVVSLYVIVSNYEYTENVEKELMLNNRLISGIISKSGTDVEQGELPFSEELKEYDYRLSIINNSGKVVYDSSAPMDRLENHNDRSEVIEARDKGVGKSVRFSSTIGKNMIYVATKIDGDYIIRSSKSIEMVNIVNIKYVKYYALIITLVALITLAISSKLSYVIIKPIKDLEDVTGRVARGELDKRVKVISKDEIGQLGKTFNFMADRLQFTLKDSIDKQNKLEAILRSMDSGVIAIDRNNRIMMINPYAKKIFGVNRDIIGRSLMDHIRDFEIDNLLHSEEGAYKEIKIFWPSEKTLRIKTADIVNDSEHIGTVAVVHDITDIKRLENMRTEFVANVSHELKTPLTSIKGFAETLRYVQDEEKKEKFINIIDDEAERLTRLINDILTLSDLEIHREENNEIINVEESIMQVYNLMKHTSQGKTIDISLNIKKKGNIMGSKDKFKQMLINLVDNAVKYSDEGDRVEIGTTVEENNCIIWVEDTGVGISPEHLPRLFERFYRVDKARSRARGGTGLGLAIVKHIVIGLKGTIDVESTVGEGSKFIIHIPLKNI